MAHRAPERTKPRTVYTNRGFEDQLLYLRELHNMNSSEIIRMAVALMYTRIRGEAQ